MKNDQFKKNCENCSDPEMGLLPETDVQTFPHHFYDHPPERLPLLLGEVLEDVAIFFLQQFEAHGQVVIFQH